MILSAENTPVDLWNFHKDLPEFVEAIGEEEKILEIFSRLPSRGLAVVGTRTPQLRSINLVQKAIRALRGTDFVILSGFARGIDRVAHETALEAGLSTVAILGCGVDVIYPEEHRQLKEDILKNGGALVSEFPGEEIPYPGNFLQRNRLIAGWSQATWIVEAPHRSGAMNTAKWANEFHRKLFATPCYPGDPAFAGNQRLIDREHAENFWNVSSLGSQWLELATHDLQKKNDANTSSAALRAPRTKDEQVLLRKIRLLRAEHSSVFPQDLLEWAMSLGWPPHRYFETLNHLLQQGALIEKNGLLLKSEVDSD
jgi:DNA protecting protein DprA